jgi:hypothetical protein
MSEPAESWYSGEPPCGVLDNPDRCKTGAFEKKRYLTTVQIKPVIVTLFQGYGNSTTACDFLYSVHMQESHHAKEEGHAQIFDWQVQDFLLRVQPAGKHHGF